MSAAARDIAAVRRFNRFFTRRIGLLAEGLAKSPFPLTEARVLYEFAQREVTSAGALAGELGLDPGYLSRILAGFRRKGLVRATPSASDGRRTDLALTKAGRAAFAPLDRGTREEIARLLAPLAPAARGRLVAAMAEIERLLADGRTADGAAPLRTLALRDHRPGDIGWVIARHGALYAAEYGWDISFEALVAEIAAGFLRNFDPDRERCWIAEIDGRNVGSVFVVKQSDEAAKLRLLIVEPDARGLGVGSRLVEECLRFARERGYRTLTLWTNDVLVSARAIYVKAGFQLMKSEPHRSFGRDLIGEYWEREL